MIALIMAGGIGSRFWPLSREKNPKQFLSIVSQDSMIRLTVERLKKRIKIKDIYIVTAANQVELVKQHLPELPQDNIIIEPFGMNTAPCLALSLAWLGDKYSENETMLVAPADHLITNTSEFYQRLAIAEANAENDLLVTFGIKPDYPATSYGYIEAGKQISADSWQVAKFKEKPDKETAKQYLDTGRFFWNSGMFIWKIKTIRDAFIRLQPQIWQLVEAIRESWKKDGKYIDISALYQQMPRQPVDIGILEKSDNIAVIPSDFGWSDVGGWKALYDVLQKDEEQNVFQKEHLTIDSSSNLVFSDKMVSLIGVNDLVIIETDDAMLIADKNRSEEVKRLVQILNEKDRKEFL